MDERKNENKKTTENKWWRKLLSFIKEKNLVFYSSNDKYWLLDK